MYYSIIIWRKHKNFTIEIMIVLFTDSWSIMIFQSDDDLSVQLSKELHTHLQDVTLSTSVLLRDWVHTLREPKPHH